MTARSGHSTDLSPVRRAFTGIARSLAAASAALLVAAAVASPGAASSAPATTPSPTPEPTPPPSGNASPEFLECPGVIAQAGTPESVGLRVTDPDGDPVSLSASESSSGAETRFQDTVLTYTAPADFSGQDFIQVTAADGRGGTAICDLSIWVEAQPEPTPTESPSPTKTPTPEPTFPAPSPTETTPAPSASPTSAPAPTAEPTSAPPTPAPSETTAPRPPSGGDTPVPGGTGDSGTGGSGADGSPTTPGTPGSPGGDAASTGGSADGSAGSPTGTPSTGASSTTSASPGLLHEFTHGATVSSSLQAVTDARTLINALATGMVTPLGVGSALGDAAAAEDDTASTPGPADRTATVPGTMMVLFAGMAVVLLLFVILSLAALPRDGRRQ